MFMLSIALIRASYLESLKEEIAYPYLKPNYDDSGNKSRDT